MVRITSKSRTYPELILAARENRKAMTTAEHRLWDAIRARKLVGLKFRKQHPLDHYIIDFYCVEQMLAIEVDGGVHLFHEQQELDQERTRFLQTKGIRVLRFTNEEILNQLDCVLERIAKYVQENPLKQW